MKAWDSWFGIVMQNEDSHDCLERRVGVVQGVDLTPLLLFDKADARLTALVVFAAQESRLIL
ncbi:MAG: hypothetical protein C4532_17675 [Candidatus Abyssobacteria bacterium SURF_17]|uniref:Uncharacterized protein n=1 Tax=Candidatus Abyssobacteria bacterium SURF_17 TaxID=2093361 RepID=A0A419EQ73_9BACT|nr:MAG: hypothetical protein C4532_17675 [Candidatus Abyssubacteria bacterium SURF_17]